MAAMIMGWIPEGKFDIDHGLLLCASSLVTASLASFVLGALLICFLILVCFSEKAGSLEVA